MANFNAAKIIVSEYSIEEVLESIFELHTIGKQWLTKAVKEQNIGYAGMAVQAYNQAESLARALHEKLNGKKQHTVV